ncbi:MAG: hypothetical protein RLZZ241_1659 [Bacteroidota bacterium]|jgi:hypothetical protein
MKHSVLSAFNTLFFAVLVFGGLNLFAQDSIPDLPSDSIIRDTLVIRNEQYPIRTLRKNASIGNPRISFQDTKPLDMPYKPFRTPSFWEEINLFELQLSEVAFVNWNAGGENSVSANGRMYLARNYKFRYFQWKNDLEMRFGWNAQEGRKWRKTDDAIRMSSTVGYRRDTISGWYFSVKFNFNTQFAAGYSYPDRTQAISKFMSPGYLFFGAGTSYIPDDKKFNLYVSPLTFKGTYVFDQILADQGAFGVKRALIDAEGNIIQRGENHFTELGFLLTNQWEFPLMENITVNSDLTLYTDYLRVFGNIDVYSTLNFTFKVNDFVNANLLTQIIYDDDIKFNREVALDGTVISAGGARTQFRQQLGIGINYNF